MLKPNFNPMFYTFFTYNVYKPGRRGPKTSMKPLDLNTSSSEKQGNVDMVNERKEKKKSLETKASSYKKELIALVNSKLKDNDTDAKNLGKRVISQVDSLVTKYSTKINAAKDAKALLRLESLFKAEIKFVDERIKYTIEGLEKREKMKEAFLKHQNEVYEWAWDEHENVGSKLRDKGDWNNLKLVTVAYLHQWKKVYGKSLDKASPDNLHVLYDQNFDSTKGMFKSGPLMDDLDGIKNNIKEVLKRWLNDEERTVYKDEDWGDDYYKVAKKWTYIRDTVFDNDKDIFGDFEYFIENSSRYQGSSNRRDGVNKMLDSIPLPDWGDGKSKNITSSLTKEYFDKKAAELLKGRFKRRAELMAKFKGVNVKSLITNNVDLMGDVQALQYLHAQVGRDSSNIIKPWGREHHQVKYLGVFDKEIQILTKIASRIKGGKPKVAVAANPKKAPKIKEVKVGKGGISVVGENLPQVGKSITIDPTDAWVDLNKGIKSGVQTVDMGSGTTSIDKNLTTILKNAVKRAISGINGVADPDAVMSKISDAQLKALKKETLDKHKPEIVVWGVASREGGFETNKRIAKARAESAKRKLEKQNPGVKIITKWAIQGFGKNGKGEKVTNREDYKQDEKNMIDEWNKNLGKTKKIKSAKEIYAKLNKSSSWTPEEKIFFDFYFLNARKAALALEYPGKKQAPQIAMNFEKSPNSTV
jgi:hypothetical protein